jgi:hypothetical protein
MDDFWMIFTILHHFAFMFKAQVTITGSTFMDDVWMIFSINKCLLELAMHCFAFIEISSDYKNRIPLSWMIF